ncbi:MAG TPA: M48 family metalloprotease [Candidatus Binatia bacterium]|nr:M48 family metalloprotease [Candidatus Binatia bacterium]
MSAYGCGIALAAVWVCGAALPAHAQNLPPAAPAPQYAAGSIPVMVPENAPNAARGDRNPAEAPAELAMPTLAEVATRDKPSGLNLWSPEREFALGQQLDRQLLASTQLVDDPAVSAYVSQVARRVAGTSSARVPVQVRVIASNEPNSFSLPGGFVYISAGMVQETESEAELAAVLAHEVAHVSCRHATREMTERQILTWFSMVLMFVGGPAGLALNEAAFFGVPLAEQKISRKDEVEADAVGLRYLLAGGYDPTAAVSLFERMASHERLRGPRIQRIFLSHPLTRDRLAAINREMNKLPEREDYVVSTSQYEGIMARLKRLGFVPDSKGPTLLRRTREADVEP